MKFIHLSDLHIGKTVNGYSMIEDQRFIIKQILNTIDETKANAVLISGDIYDKSVPSAEAVTVFDEFLTELCRRPIDTLIISGNHDSAERLSFGEKIFEQNGLHISPVFTGAVKTVTLSDRFGAVNFYLLPFIKPSMIRKYYPNIDITDTNSALKTVLSNINVDSTVRNVLLCHQFVTGATKSESEEIFVGGSDNVDISLFAPFDYTALGHLHMPQTLGDNYVRYCGSPLKYSFSEAAKDKSVTLVELNEKDNITVTEYPLNPLHDMRELKGSYEQITAVGYNDPSPSDYVHITLTDEIPDPGALSKLREFYPNIMKLDYDNMQTRHFEEISGADSIANKTPTELFCELYKSQNGDDLSDDMTKIINEIFEQTED